MEKINILFGFNDPNFEAAVKALLRSKGYDAQINARFSKKSVINYLEKNPDCNVIVIPEVFPKNKDLEKGQQPYTAEEVAQLTDMSDVNVIILLSEKHQGTDYMKTLYTAGITNAIFQHGAHGGAKPREIAALILQKRTRKSAREYYGISSQKIEFGFLENSVFDDFYKKLEETDEKSMLENYLTVCGQMTPQQIADFTRRLPADDKNYLAQFEEFHTVVQLLKKFGIDMKIKRPRRVTIGLRNTVGISATEDSIIVKPNNVSDNEKMNSELTKQESVKEESPEEVSMADIFSSLASDTVDDEDEDLDCIIEETSQEAVRELEETIPEKEKDSQKQNDMEMEEGETEEVIFEDYDDSYDKLTLGIDSGSHVSIPFIITIIVFVILLIVVFVIGGNISIF